MGKFCITVSILGFIFSCKNPQNEENPDNSNQSSQFLGDTSSQATKKERDDLNPNQATHVQPRPRRRSKNQNITKDIKIKLSELKFEWDESFEAYLLKNDKFKAPILKKFNEDYDQNYYQNFKKEYGEPNYADGPGGIDFDLNSYYPKFFKKILWVQSENDLKEAKHYFMRGYLAISNNENVFKSWKKDSFILFFHPKLPKSARYLYDLVYENNTRRHGPSVNQFQIGVLLGYKIQDAFYWSFGKNNALNAYKNTSIKFKDESRDGYSIEEQRIWKKEKLDNLKQAIGDEWKFIAAGEEPDWNFNENAYW